MSKHQECEECKCDFVGPNRNVGDNLCEDCYVERHNPCLFAIEQLKEQLGTKQGEIERLQAIVGDLPRMPDGDYLQCPLCRQCFDDEIKDLEAIVDKVRAELEGPGELFDCVQEIRNVLTIAAAQAAKENK